MLHSCWKLMRRKKTNSHLPTVSYLISLGQSPLLFMLTHTFHDENSPRKFLTWFMSKMWNICSTYMFAWGFISCKPSIFLNSWRLSCPEGHCFINFLYNWLFSIAAKSSADSPAPIAPSALPLCPRYAVCLCAVLLCFLAHLQLEFNHKLGAAKLR